MNLDNSRTVIGSNEYIDFRRQNVLKVPAKIDTGADSSAVWASDIKLIEGKVVFKLFGSSSKFYTGKTIVSSSFRTSLIKNTSGVKERRFKVRLSVRIKDRNIRTWFTLADRSDMIYPVLLGRRTLHKKFIVDVSQKSVKDLD